MRKIKVKTLYNGTVGIAEKLVRERVDGNLPLEVWHGDKCMTIPSPEIKGKITGKSELFNDRFGGAPYRLLYFVWKPDEPAQASLL